MKLITALFAAALLLAGCSGSSDDASTAPTTATPTDASRSADRDTLDQQAQAQAEQKAAAQKQLADEVSKKADDLRSGTVRISIKDGKVTPQGDRVEVKVGQKITLVVTSDVDEEIHVHSEPEHSYEVPAGGSISESFTIDTPGQVAVEAHGLDVTIVQLVVRP